MPLKDAPVPTPFSTEVSQGIPSWAGRSFHG
jgi:hypothetical protein